MADDAPEDSTRSRSDASTSAGVGLTTHGKQCSRS